MVNVSKVFLLSFIITIIQNTVSYLLLFFVSTRPATFWGLLVFSGFITWVSAGFYLNDIKESLIVSGIFNILLFPLLVVLLYTLQAVSIKLVNVINLETIINSSTLENLTQSIVIAFVISLIVFIITTILAVSSSLFRSRVLEYQGTTSIDQYESAHFEKYETASTAGEYVQYDDEEQ